MGSVPSFEAILEGDVRESMPGTLETKDDKQMKFAHFKINKSLSNIQYNPPP